MPDTDQGGRRSIIPLAFGRFGSPVAQGVEGAGRRPDMAEIERINRENIWRDDREILEILTIFSQCRN